jgi:hypothetical protein
MLSVFSYIFVFSIRPAVVNETKDIFICTIHKVFMGHVV